MNYVQVAEQLGRVVAPLLRIVEFECYWLVKSADLEAKMILGSALGRHGAAAVSLLQHFRRISLDGLLPPVNSPCELVLRDVPEEASVEQVLSFVGEYTKEVCTYLESVLVRLEEGSFSPLHDPTIAAVRAAIETLREVAEAGDGCGKRVQILQSDEDGVAERSEAPVGWKLPKFPGRDPSLVKLEGQLLSAPPAELIESVEGRRELLFFFFIDIEIAASEVCAGNIILYPDSPIDFKLDMARQIWDECRHARAVYNRFKELGGRCEGRMYARIVWDRWSLARTLPEKIAVEQIIQEGNGVDASPALASRFRHVGDDKSADLIDMFMMDECLHAGFGNKWMLELTGRSLDDYRTIVDQAAALIGVPLPGSSPVFEKARAHAGFPEEIIAELLRRQSG